ncbi:hypothetical protein, partial [Clostridium sp.]|uniref:hypothetical protein n=1 Tax=Clostridium sp. TaxID=1506 RepID=UPI003F394F07
VNIVGKSLNEAISILEENGLSIKIESKDEGIKKLLESEATRIKNEYDIADYKRGSIVVVDIENNNLLGKLTYN